MRVIIVGLGGIGENLAMIAVREKHNVVVIDTDPKKCGDIVTKSDLISVNGDATSAMILEEAGISEADVVVSTTSSDAVNLMVMLQARDKGVKYLRAIANDPEHAEIFKKEGITIHKNPDAIVAEVIYNNILHGRASTTSRPWPGEKRKSWTSPSRKAPAWPARRSRRRGFPPTCSS